MLYHIFVQVCMRACCFDRFVLRPVPCMYVCMYACMYAVLITLCFVLYHIFVQVCMQACIYMYVSLSCIFFPEVVHSYIHTFIHTYMHACMHKPLHMQSLCFSNFCTDTSLFRKSFIHPYTYNTIHTYIKRVYLSTYRYISVFKTLHTSIHI